MTPQPPGSPTTQRQALPQGEGEEEGEEEMCGGLNTLRPPNTDAGGGESEATFS